MMSALGGREGLPQEQERVLISCVSVKMTRGGGPKIPLNEPIRVCARMAAAYIDHIS